MAQVSRVMVCCESDTSDGQTRRKGLYTMRIEVVTAVRNVTVFPNGALVTREGTAHVEEPGEHELVVGGLPLSAQPDSLRASGQGPIGTQILGVELEREFHADPPQATLQQLQDAIHEHEERIGQLRGRREMIAQQEQWLGTLGEQSARSFAWGVARGNTRPADIAEMLTYTREEAQRLAALRLDVEREQQQAQRELEALLREQWQQGRANTPDRRAALVRVVAPATGEVTIGVSYLVHEASWSPRYDARVDVAVEAVNLLHQGLISQHTGEDWPDVALALSTARPSAAMRLPDDPTPWYLDVQAPPSSSLVRNPMAMPPAPAARRSARMSSAADDFGEFADMSLPAPGTPAPLMASPITATLNHASAIVETTGAARTFRLPGRSDVPSDGEPHTLGVGAYELPCRFEYVAEPIVSPGAHLRAMARNSIGQALLPGALHVFHATTTGDEYAGQTWLELTAENAELPLYLGVDDNMPVKRDLVERETERGNLLQSGVRKVTLGYSMKVTNHTGKPQRVVLKDALPLSRHERIKVRVLDVQPQPSTRSGLDQLTWEFTLDPEAVRQVQWRVLVEAPSGLQITGLP